VCRFKSKRQRSAGTAGYGKQKAFIKATRSHEGVIMTLESLKELLDAQMSNIGISSDFGITLKI